MGSREDSLDDERADALMRRLLARAGEPAQPPVPPDLVSRTARRLPAAAPALAAQAAARRRAIRIAITATLLGLVGLIALVSLAGMVAGDPRLAMLFGDGGSGPSRALLTLYLLAKPIVRVVGAVGAPLLLAGVIAFVAGGWLWRRLLLLAPVYTYLEDRR
jgi:hypothetical protein